LEPHVQMYGDIIIQNIRQLEPVFNTGTRSETYKIHDAKLEGNYFVKVVVDTQELTTSHPDNPRFKILPTETAPWYQRPPEKSTKEYGLYISDRFQHMKQYKHFNIPPTQVCTVSLDNGSYKHFFIQKEADGDLIRRVFPNSNSALGEQEYELSILSQLSDNNPSSINNLKLLAKDLIDLLNRDHFLPDLNYGVLSTDNIFYDPKTGKFSLVDVADTFDLPEALLSQLDSWELLINREGKVNDKLVKFINDNKSFDKPDLGKLEDWLRSIKGIINWRVV